MRLSSPVWLVLLWGATAAAHEASFRAAWVQPLAPLLARNLIVPMGLNHGLGPGTDLTLEVTPYAGLPAPQFGALDVNGGVCAGGFCARSLYGLIAAVGLALERPFFSAADWEADMFVGTKALVAVATEPGDLALGASYELGGGIDLGVEIHAHRSGFYAAILLGVQLTTAFGSGGFIIPATWPVAIAPGAPLINRNEGVATSPNFNLVRLGWVF